MRNLIMLYGKYCLNSKLMLPYIKELNEKKKFEFKIVDSDSKEGGETKEKYGEILGKNRDSYPVFIDIEKNQAIQAPDAESLMEWLLGEEWWTKL